MQKTFDEIAEMYRQGMTVAEIGRATGKHQTMVKKS